MLEARPPAGSGVIHLAANVGSRKNSATANAMLAATVVQASGPLNLTSSAPSSWSDTSADQRRARMPSPSESQSIPKPRTKGHCPHFFV